MVHKQIYYFEVFNSRSVGNPSLIFDQNAQGLVDCNLKRQSELRTCATQNSRIFLNMAIDQQVSLGLDVYSCISVLVSPSYFIDVNVSSIRQAVQLQGRRIWKSFLHLSTIENVTLRLAQRFECLRVIGSLFFRAQRRAQYIP